LLFFLVFAIFVVNPSIMAAEVEDGKTGSSTWPRFTSGLSQWTEI